MVFVSQCKKDEIIISQVQESFHELAREFNGKDIVHVADKLDADPVAIIFHNLCMYFNSKQF